jgi:hypothetical protein
MKAKNHPTKAVVIMRHSQEGGVAKRKTGRKRSAKKRGRDRDQQQIGAQ